MRFRLLPVALAVALTTSGCTAFSEFRGGSATESTASSGAGREAAAAVVTSGPDEPLTVLTDPDPVVSAAAMSGALFDSAPVVVLARVGDRAGELLAASAAVGLGVPLLLEPEGGGASEAVSTEAVAAEAERLGAETVLAVGDADGRVVAVAAGEAADRAVVSVPADPSAVEEATGLGLGAAEEVPDDGAVAAVAALDPDRPVALQPADAPDAPPAGAGGGELPTFGRGDPLTGTVVLAAGDPESLAALATARAAGAPVTPTDGETDPRASAAALEALTDAEAVVAVGTAFADEDGLDWKVATAATGVALPGGGQVLFPGRLLVALYGHPGTPSLGVLGEQDIEASIARARDHAAPYAELVDATVVPAFEIIATVASSAPGADGDYSDEADPEVLRPWVEAAGEAGVYVLLDLQPGRTDFLTQAERYRSLLELPHVGLALDPEWRLGPNDVHLTAIGSVGVDEVNRVVAWLADLTREHALPQKLLVIHQFRLAMLPDRERLDTSRDELAVMVHADGQGAQADKQDTWRTLHENPPAGIFWGWKNFYDEDQPMLTPEQTIAQVDPRPDLISYQ